jgi:hypothetical protein
LRQLRQTVAVRHVEQGDRQFEQTGVYFVRLVELLLKVPEGQAETQVLLTRYRIGKVLFARHSVQMDEAELHSAHGSVQAEQIVDPFAL